MPAGPEFPEPCQLPCASGPERAMVWKPEAWMSDNESILVVEDDPDIRSLIADYFAGQGYQVTAAKNGQEARAAIANQPPRLVILDIGLPGEDGLSIARFVREQLDIAIIIVSGANDPIDRIIGLEIGSDDYLSKPFDIRELRVRVKNVLRRYRGSNAAAAPQKPGRQIAVGIALFDPESRILLDRTGQEIPITSTEYELLKVLTERPRRVMTRDQIMTLTRNRDCDPYDRSIDICVARVRKKIERNPERPVVIRTVRGIGYMFVPEGV